MTLVKTLLRVSKCSVHFPRHNATTTTSASAGVNYCMDLLKRCDNENFLCTLLLPGQLRAKAFILRAFQVELAQIKESVKEKNLGLIRMQFWSDAINGIYKSDEIPSSLLLTELKKLIQEDKLQKIWFNRILDARKDQMASDLPHPSLQHLEDSSDHIHSSLYLLLLQAAGLKDVDSDHTASHLGRAQGLALLCRSTPYYASKGCVYLPQDLMIKHKLSQDDVIRKGNPTALTEVVYELASRANSHLDLAISHWNKLPKTAQLIFLASTPTKRYLKRLQQCHFDVHHGNLTRKDHLLPFSLVINKLKRKL